MREELMRQGVAGRRIQVIPHGTEILARMPKADARRRLGLPEEGHIVLSVGFFDHQKHNELLVDALPYLLKEVPDSHLFFSGYMREWIREDFEQRRRCEERAEELGVREHVLFSQGFIPDSDIHVAFAAADVAAFLFRPEGVSLHAHLSASGSLHLAMGAFKPIVVSRVPKFEEAWTNVSGEIAFDPNCPSELASILARLVVDGNFRERIVTRVKSHAVRTSWDVIAEDHLRLYKALLVDRHALARA
jgi:glycosyltransferase involved in cell wall biosynthesis